MIKNIIFDLGGVLLPVDPMLYAKGMQELGCKDIAALHEKFLADNVYVRFEKGQISPAEFRALLRQGFDNQVTDRQLDHAWNLMLGEVPPHRVKFLTTLRQDYRIFLLSNSNKIHYDHYQAQFSKHYGGKPMDDLFEKAYYSFQLNRFKPDRGIFEYVLKDSGLVPGETLFIDDNLANVESARKIGLRGLHLTDGMEVAEAVLSVKC